MIQQKHQRSNSMLHISRTFLSILSQEHKGNKTSVSAPVVFYLRANLLGDLESTAKVVVVRSC